MTRLNKESIDWQYVREQFELDPDYIHIGSSQFISSHPKHIKEEIKKYQEYLDKNPTDYVEKNEKDFPDRGRSKAADYLGMSDPSHIALTDSATMGHGIIYTGLNIREGQEIITEEHNHFSQQEAVQRATARTGASFREIQIYQNLADVTEEEMVQRIIDEITEKTKVIGITWVHSDTGLKYPVSRLSKEVAAINEKRDQVDRILIVVDGVHGFGIETETFEELGCDFFVTSCHKWIYGPRGTGLVAATHEAWQHVHPVIPSYRIMNQVSKKKEHPDHMDGKQMSPGGFHTLEYRWALDAAFDFVDKIGKKNIYERVHALNRQCKEGLASMPHVILHTPMDDKLSAGIISFEVDGMSTQEVVDRLRKKKIIATVAPYRSEYARLTPGIINTPEEIETVLNEVWSLKEA